MANHKRPRLSLKGDLNVPTTEPIVLPPVETRKTTQEKTMEANLNPAETQAAPSGPTAKELAALEEKNAAQAIKAQAETEQPDGEPLKIVNLAGKGYDELHDAMRKAQAANRKPPYTPPPMTERQLSAREEELEAGRRAVARNAAQQANRPQPKPDLKEGFTTPVHRPGDFVPGINSKDPAITK